MPRFHGVLFRIVVPLFPACFRRPLPLFLLHRTAPFFPSDSNDSDPSPAPSRPVPPIVFSLLFTMPKSFSLRRTQADRLTTGSAVHCRTGIFGEIDRADCGAIDDRPFIPKRISWIISIFKRLRPAAAGRQPQVGSRSSNFRSPEPPHPVPLPLPKSDLSDFGRQKCRTRVKPEFGWRGGDVARPRLKPLGPGATSRDDSAAQSSAASSSSPLSGSARI
jgi:hypothetical protein